MNQAAPGAFDSEIVLPDAGLTAKEKTLLGFNARYQRVRDQLRLLLSLAELGAWNKKHHGGKLAVCDLVSEQYPLVIFYGDVGTGKTATAECLANRIVSEARAEDFNHVQVEQPRTRQRQGRRDGDSAFGSFEQGNAIGGQRTPRHPHN